MPTEANTAPERIVLHPETLRRMNGYIYLSSDKEAGDVEYIRIDLARVNPPAAPTEVHPEDFCQRCKRPNIVWFAPNELWNKAVRAAGQPEILCPVCFVELAEVAGITGVWKVAPQAAPAAPDERDKALAQQVVMSGDSRYFDPTLIDKIAAAFAAIRRGEM